jgi:1-acyl-sn-glycerol-3-phosphate acyltransferase
MEVEPVNHGSGLEMSRPARATYRVLRTLLYTVCRIWFRVSVVGSENIPTSGGYILAPGAHRSILDTPLASLAGPRILRYMGAENYFNIPGLGWFLRAMGGFPVERAMTDRAALRVAEAVLAGGEPLVVFPEGTRQSGPIIEELKEGASFLACRAGVPIIPVGIGGAGRALPKGKRIARPTKIAIVVGAPLRPPATEGHSGGCGDGGNGTGRPRVKRSAVRALTGELRANLQSLYEQAQHQAGAA